MHEVGVDSVAPRSYRIAGKSKLKRHTNSMVIL